jgi:hypothetical protein
MASIDGIIGREEKTSLIPQDAAGAPDYRFEVVLDCVKTEAPIDDAEPTELPVEDGADITDHVKLRPTALTLTFVHSEEALDFAQPLSDPFRPKDMYGQLLEWRESKQELVVMTPHRVYRNMIITSLAPTWDSTNGRSLTASISFRQIIKVSTKTVELAASTSPKAMKKRGKKTAKVAKEGPKKSAYRALSDWVGGE